MESIPTNGHRNGLDPEFRTHVLSRPLDSGYGRFVVQAAIAFLSDAHDQRLAGIVIDAPLANEGSEQGLEAMLGEAREHGIRGELSLNGSRCEVRLIPANGLDDGGGIGTQDVRNE
jgi:hypothetical protein